MPVEPLSKYVRTDVTEVRTEQAWERIQSRLKGSPQRPPSLRWAAWGLTLASVAVFLFVQFSQNQHGLSAWDGTVLETGSGALSVELRDHSKLEVGAHSRVEAIEQTAASAEFRLARGHIECDVAPNPKRRFAVLAGEVEVIVTGTRFSVHFDPERRTTEVAVSRGSVEVRDPSGGVRRLAANERWSLHSGPTSVSAVSHQTGEALPTAETQSDLTPPVPLGAPSVAPATPPSTSALTAMERGAVNNLPADAKMLFDAAGAARRRGDAAGAARGYEALLSRFPTDPRAGLTALELARLRMDRLADPAGAVRALKIAIAQAPSASVSEDARARLVDAYQALGQLQACRLAQQTYLAKYPRGIHAQRVQTKCGGSP